MKPADAVEDPLIDAALKEFRYHVHRDQAELQRVIHSLRKKTARRSAIANRANDQNLADLTAQHHPSTIEGLPSNNDRSLMLTRGHRRFLGADNSTTKSRGVAAAADMPPANYGLPGIGDYELKRRQHQKEWKEECLKQMSQHVPQPRHRTRNNHGNAIDYEEILAKKRSEERLYRDQNADPTFFVPSLRSFHSESNLKSNEANGDHEFLQEATRAPLVDKQRHGKLAVYDNQIGNSSLTYAVNGSSNIRPHSYPIEYNSSMHPLPINTHSNGPTTAYDNRRPRRFDDGVFIVLDRTERSQVARNHPSMASKYQADLALQVEEAKQRRRAEKAEEMRHVYDMKIEEENRQYNPWGRGGGGAPVLDRQGRTLTVRGQLGNERARKVSIVAPTVEGSYSPRLSPNDEPVVLNNAVLQPSRVVAQPFVGPRPGRAAVAAVPSHEDYQEALRRQIEDKRRRELEEKERERLEEEKLMRRVQEENDKMQREYEEELKKQRQREEERLRRNEELLQRQLEQKKEAERLKKEQREKERMQEWEERERALGPHTGGSLSPPVRGTNKTDARKMSMAADNAKLLLARTAHERPHPPHHRQHSKPLLERKPTEAKQTDSQEHILSQLSAMRQQLEREQKAIQRQLQKGSKEVDYQVLDKMPAESKPNVVSKPVHHEIPPPIKYQPITKPNASNDKIPTERRPPTSELPTSTYTQPEPVWTNSNGVGDGYRHAHHYDDYDGNLERQFERPLRQSSVVSPNTVGSLEVAPSVQRTLKGDSFFLARVESDDTDNHDGYEPWQEQHSPNAWSIEDDVIGVPLARSELKYEDASDDIHDDSFLDEFMARNLHRR